MIADKRTEPLSGGEFAVCTPGGRIRQTKKPRPASLDLIATALVHTDHGHLPQALESFVTRSQRVP